MVHNIVLPNILVSRSSDGGLGFKSSKTSREVRSRVVEKFDQFEFRIRAYSNGDEVRMAALSNQYYGERPGSAIRNSEYTRWSSLAHPEVDPEGILIAEKSGEVVAYAISTNHGILLELCYLEHGKQAVPSLIEGVLKYLILVGAERLMMFVPSDDHFLGRVLIEFGFSSRPQGNLTVVRCLDFKVLIESLIKSQKSEQHFNAFCLKLMDSLPPDQDYLVTRNEKGVQVSQIFGRKETSDLQCDFQIEISKQDMMLLLFSGASPIMMFLRRRLRVKPLRRLPLSLKILSRLRVNQHWHTPMTDRG